MQYNAASASKPHRKPHERLSQVNILILDADNQMAMILRNVLNSLGFGAIYHARNGESGVRLLRDKNIDLVITDWDMHPVDGIEFISYIRTAKDSPNKTLPIIMLTGKAHRDQVEMARDSGMTEFVVKPFTVQTLCNRIILVVEHPRNFILAPTYSGPDRRRREQNEAGAERRTPLEKAKILSTTDNTKSVRINEQDIVFVDADFSLKDKIGSDISIKEIFSAEEIELAQKIIFEAKDEFLQWIAGDMRDLEAAYNNISCNPLHSTHDIKVLSGCILSIKSRSGTFGFDLASVVADMMLKLIRHQKNISTNLLRVIRKHIDVLYVIYQRRIEGTGGDLGRDLMDTLTALAKKFSDTQ